MKKKFIVAMPAHNEEKYIANVIIGCRGIVDEVIVVNDGSTDNTGKIARSTGAIVVDHGENMGYGAAIKSCFNAAIERNADVMIIIDSDGQHDPRDIIRIIEPVSNGGKVDIVIGSRVFSCNKNNIPIYRKIGMKVLDYATTIAGGVEVSDTQSGFRAYSRKAIEQIKLNGNNGMFVGSEILLEAKELGLKICEIPITCRYDQGESSENPISHGYKVLSGLIMYMLRKRTNRRCI